MILDLYELLLYYVVLLKSLLLKVTITTCMQYVQHNSVRCLLIDFSKAFDTVDCCIIFNKLKLLNLPLNYVLKWFVDFHTDRTHVPASIKSPKLKPALRCHGLLETMAVSALQIFIAIVSSAYWKVIRRF